MRLGRAFTRPTYVDGEDQEPGAPEAVAPDNDATVAVIDASHDVSVADVLAWLEDEAVVVHSGPGGRRAVWSSPGFRHHDSRHRMPLLHDHLVVSVKVLRANGTWSHFDSRRLFVHVVAGRRCTTSESSRIPANGLASDRAVHAHTGAAAR